MESLNQRFETLRKRWVAETAVVSDPHEISENKSYREIIGLGQGVLPLILDDLDRTHCYWFPALRELTKCDPVPPQYKGNIAAMAEIWLSSPNLQLNPAP
jgi:hypothetical protein